MALRQEVYQSTRRLSQRDILRPVRFRFLLSQFAVIQGKFSSPAAGEFQLCFDQSTLTDELFAEEHDIGAFSESFLFQETNIFRCVVENQDITDLLLT